MIEEEEEDEDYEDTRNKDEEDGAEATDGGGDAGVGVGVGAGRRSDAADSLLMPPPPPQHTAAKVTGDQSKWNEKVEKITSHLVIFQLYSYLIVSNFSMLFLCFSN